MSYHGYKDLAITLHNALHPIPAITTLAQKSTSEWRELLKQIIEGCNCLHSKYKIIHNDLKCDNIVLTSESTLGGLRPIIVDFNKACKIGKGKKI